MDAGHAELSNAQVVGIAGAASGAIAGAIVAAGRSRERDDAAPRGGDAAGAAEDLATGAVERVRAAAGRAGDTGRRLAEAGGERARDASHRLEGARGWGRRQAGAVASLLPSSLDVDRLKAAGAGLAGGAATIGKRA